MTKQLLPSFSRAFPIAEQKRSSLKESKEKKQKKSNFSSTHPPWGTINLLLNLTTVDDLGLDGCFDGPGAAASALDVANNIHGLLLVGAESCRRALYDLAEDDMFAIKPAGLRGGDEELGAVAVKRKGKSRLADG